ncbi:MAG: NADH-quinone oxidoreductase subunit L, partial [Thermoanaerobaculia bacterium]
MLNNLWLIPILPFLGFLVNGIFGKRAGKGFVSAVALLASLGAALAGTVAVFQYTALYHHGERHLNVVYEWFNSGGIGADIAFQLDPLSIVMLMVVTWIGFLIHVYSVGYMHDDEGYWR